MKHPYKTFLVPFYIAFNIAFPTIVHADIYKIIDSQGITRYTNKPTISNQDKATPNEIVNSLQSKDVCTSTNTTKAISTIKLDSINNNTSNFSNMQNSLNQFKSSIQKNLKINTIKILDMLISDAQAITLIQTGLMPAVDINSNITPAVGYSDLRIKSYTEIPLATGGAYRVVCTPSHMSNDDPLIYPNQQGVAHHHTFFGNTSLNYKSDLNNLSLFGNSTCRGGLLNRSAYWIPSMINTSNNKPIIPNKSIIYYKTGYVPANLITAPPKGLKILAGNSKATTEATSNNVHYTCAGRTPFYGWQKTIPSCNVGELMGMMISFPQCWDGKNLDSPNHQSHMAYSSRYFTTANRCPTTHPIAIPHISFNFSFLVNEINSNKIWRLASDNYSKDLPGGLSGHGDWVNGWNQNLLNIIVTKCLNKNVDCHAHLFGDGRGAD